MTAGSSRISRCSTNPSAPTGPSRAKTSLTTTPVTPTAAQPGRHLHYRRQFTTPRTGVMKDNSIRYRASKRDCEACPLKPHCCPNAPARKITRSIYEGARDLAREIAKTDEYQTSRRQRKKVEMLFAHLKRILKLDRLRLRGPSGA